MIVTKKNVVFLLFLDYFDDKCQKVDRPFVTATNAKHEDQRNDNDEALKRVEVVSLSFGSIVVRIKDHECCNPFPLTRMEYAII